jgi:hypothetical protein
VSERLAPDTTCSDDGRENALDKVLAEAFMIVDVMQGALVDRASFLDAIAESQLAFDAIEPGERRVRRYPGTAVITGHTEMQWRFGEAQFATRSRCTHVFVDQDCRWRLVAAQGTQIAP